jgi:hypothetical protein
MISNKDIDMRAMTLVFFPLNVNIQLGSFPLPHHASVSSSQSKLHLSCGAEIPTRSGRSHFQTCQSDLCHISESESPNRSGRSDAALPVPNPLPTDHYSLTCPGWVGVTAHFPLSPFRINTCRNRAKKPTLTIFRINTYRSVHPKGLELPLESTLMKNIGGRGVLWLTRNPKMDFYTERPSGTRGTSLSCSNPFAHPFDLHLHTGVLESH